MTAEVLIRVGDSVGRESTWRLPVSNLAIPTDYATFITGVIAAAFGTALPSLGSVKQASLVLSTGLYNEDVTGVCDVRDNWQTRLANATDVMRMGIPARNPSAALISTGSLILGDLTDTSWAGLQTALLGGTVKLVIPETGVNPDAFSIAVANVRARKRPRVGGTR